MSYELRVNGRPVEICDRPEDALARVRVWLRTDPDAEPEVRDTTTGRAIGPAASLAWREEMAKRIGF